MCPHGAKWQSVSLQGISHALTLQTVLDWKMRHHARILFSVRTILKFSHT